jgi:molybdopterin-synthase adenylyltransferase
MTRPVRLSPSAGITPTGAGVILRSDLGTFQVAGPDTAVFVDRMVPLLDGSRDREAIAAALPGYAGGSVAAFLRLLEDHGLIEEVPGAEAHGRGQEAFLRAWPAAGDAAERLARARVICVGRGPWGAAAANALGAAGLSEVRAVDESSAIGGELWSLIVAAVPPADLEEVERVARLAHRANLVSLWSHLAGTKAVLGPLVTPGITACRICATAPGLNPELEAGPGRAAAAKLLGHFVAMEAIRVISGYAPSDLGGRILIEDLATLEISLHTLVRLPWCRVCGPTPG